ncbi:GNAT family N-acetyltransferase [Microbacterium suaedae]|uniref:GNAT family N-acetyltransferase n=1 Tax=Microbacterium suaedae TaxID=2067813 RepID=UPI0013A64EEC|nr:GNAT family N-acetyltransferase [Microbacterium suaedae]
MNLAIDTVHVPASVDAPDAGDWRAYIDTINASYQHDAGSDLLESDPAVTLAAARSHEHRVVRAFLARSGGTVVGAGELTYDRSTNRDVEFMVSVHPDARGRGVGDAVCARLEREARDLGRSYALVYAPSPLDPAGLTPDAVLRPSSGIGGIPRDDEHAQTLVGRGYELGQVERASAYFQGSDPDALRERLDEALAAAGPEYEPVWWSGPTPEAYVDGYAAAIARMGTDVPSGDHEWEPEVWDAERIRARELRAAATGQVWAITAVVHRPTGAVAAFNELVVAPDRTKPTENYGTLVVPEHRGRRLGTIVKCLGLLRWHELFSESPAVVTFNAEENRHMLDVNEAVGFRPVFWEGSWHKHLT